MLRARRTTFPDKCADNGGLLGCLFEPPNDPLCLGTSARSVATDLVDAIFDQDE